MALRCTNAYESHLIFTSSRAHKHAIKTFNFKAGIDFFLSQHIKHDEPNSLLLYKVAKLVKQIGFLGLGGPVFWTGFLSEEEMSCYKEVHILAENMLVDLLTEKRVVRTVFVRSTWYL